MFNIDQFCICLAPFNRCDFFEIREMGPFLKLGNNNKISTNVKKFRILR